jgi:hypothetical protein
MHLDKAILTHSGRDEFSGERLKNLNHYGETSVLIKNTNGQPSKFIRISSFQGSMNVEIEYKEEKSSYPGLRRADF